MNHIEIRAENQQAVADGEAYYCDNCNGLSEGDHCPACHVGCCDGCGRPVSVLLVGVVRDEQFGGVFHPRCA